MNKPIWYSKQGDDGYTGLPGGARVAKDARRIEALGALDEATSFIGLARAQARAETKPLLERVQRELILLMAEVASPDPTAPRERLEASAVAALEAEIARLSATVAMPREFILPGDTPGGAALDAARAVVRRAERRVVTLAHGGELAGALPLRYLNRLSSLLFLLARVEEA